MMSIFRNIVLFYSILNLFACQGPSSDTLVIAASANLQFVLPELVNVFEEDTQIKCEVVLGSSGKLTAQIQQGAPFDIFLSADIKYPEILDSAGLAISKPVIYANGKLVFWSTLLDRLPNIKQLPDEQIKHIALPNPKTAPYGEAAMEVLLHFGITEQVKPRLVFGENVGQASQFISTGAVELGFTAKSVVLANAGGVWEEIPSNLYRPIHQGMVILKNNRNKLASAEKLYAFILSEKAQSILKGYGY